MPIDTKNRLVKRSRSASESDRAWWPVLGVGQHHAGQECPEGQREPGHRRHPRDGRRDEHDGEHEQVAPAGRRHVVQRAGHDPARQRERRGHHRHGRDQHAEDRRRAAPLAGQRGHEQDHRHDAQVLEEQHADDELAVRGVDLAALRQALEHDGRARERDQEPEEQRLRRPGAPCGRDAGRHRHRQKYLKPAADAQDPAQAAHLTERKLEADGEEKEDHADFGEAADLLDVLNPAESRRPQRRPGDDEAGDGRQLDAAEHQHDGHRRGEDDDQVAEGHVSPSGAC